MTALGGFAPAAQASPNYDRSPKQVIQPNRNAGGWVRDSIPDKRQVWWEKISREEILDWGQALSPPNMLGIRFIIFIKKIRTH
jgi:hypothetical protein